MIHYVRNVVSREWKTREQAPLNYTLLTLMDLQKIGAKAAACARRRPPSTRWLFVHGQVKADEQWSVQAFLKRHAADDNIAGNVCISTLWACVRPRKWDLWSSHDQLFGWFQWKGQKKKKSQFIRIIKKKIHVFQRPLVAVCSRAGRSGFMHRGLRFPSTKEVKFTRGAKGINIWKTEQKHIYQMHKTSVPVDNQHTSHSKSDTSKLLDL